MPAYFQKVYKRASQEPGLISIIQGEGEVKK